MADSFSLGAARPLSSSTRCTGTGWAAVSRPLRGLWARSAAVDVDGVGGRIVLCRCGAVRAAARAVVAGLDSSLAIENPSSVSGGAGTAAGAGGGRPSPFKDVKVAPHLSQRYRCASLLVECAAALSPSLITRGASVGVGLR